MFIQVLYVPSICAVGTYGDKRAKLYDLVITEVTVAGNVMEREESAPENTERDYTELLKGTFKFVQTEDGSVPATLFSREEDLEIINTKKAIVSAFQANFEGTKLKQEADPQSLHTSEYT